MRLISCALALFATLFLAISPSAAQKPAAEMYGSLPAVDDLAISPDGKTLALIRSFGESSAVLFYDINNMAADPTGVSLGDSKPRSLRWADNEYLLLLVSQAEKKRTTAGIEAIEFMRWLSISKTEAKAKLLFGNAAGYYQSEAGTLLSTVPSKSGTAIFQRDALTGSRSNGPSRFSGDRGFTLSLFEVDLEKGRDKKIESGNSETVDWVVDLSGTPIARIDYDWSQSARQVYINNDGNWILKASLQEDRNELAVASFYGKGEQPGTLLATTTPKSNGDRLALVEFDIERGVFSRTLFSNPTYSINNIDYNPARATIDAVIFTDDIPRALFLDPDLQKTQDALTQALPGASPMIISRSSDNQKMIIKALYTDHPPQFFVFDRQAKSLNMIAATYPPLDGRVQAKKTKYDYTTDDGFTVHGYLTSPVGSSMQDMPLVVLPHGGPQSRDDQTFDWWSFFYAARGYLVYQPNFRGSSGYGGAFVSAGENQWGKKMQDDITDGVRKLIADGIVDQDRICIAGASYGGYAALSGATTTPDLYQCVVSVAGLSNLATLLSEAGENSIWERRIGSRFADKDYIEEVSPYRNASNVSAPVLLMHGDQDVVVPIGQSRIMKNALEKAGKDVTFTVLKDEDHWLSRSATRTQMLQESIEFIDRHIGQ